MLPKFSQSISNKLKNPIYKCQVLSKIIWKVQNQANVLPLSALNICHLVIPDCQPWPRNAHGPTSPGVTSHKLSVLDGAGAEPLYVKAFKISLPLAVAMPIRGQCSPPQGTWRSRDLPPLPWHPKVTKTTKLSLKSWEKLAREFLKRCTISQNLSTVVVFSLVFSLASHITSP